MAVTGLEYSCIIKANQSLLELALLCLSMCLNRLLSHLHLNSQKRQG